MNVPQNAEEMLAQWNAQREANKLIPKDEFLARFKARMLAVAGEKFDDGESIADYADEIGPTYYDDENQHEEGPEECADADMSYWGED